MVSYEINKRLAKLDDGRIVEYDVCSKNKKNCYSDNNSFTYLGEGVIYSIDDTIQIGAETKYHFFIRNDRKWSN
jgi:hypothetical protein